MTNILFPLRWTFGVITNIIDVRIQLSWQSSFPKHLEIFVHDINPWYSSHWDYQCASCELCKLTTAFVNPHFIDGMTYFMRDSFNSENDDTMRCGWRLRFNDLCSQARVRISLSSIGYRKRYIQFTIAKILHLYRAEYYINNEN